MNYYETGDIVLIPVGDGRKMKFVIEKFDKYLALLSATCLWVVGLPDLKPSNIVEGREQRIWKLPPSPDRTALRSKTYPGIAKAMAQQWG